MLYAGLARLGTTVPLTERAADTRRAARRAAPAAGAGRGLVCRQRAARHAAARERRRRPHRLQDRHVSYGYRDAWSVGFDGKRTIGVWVGRPDGAPVPGLVGRTAAAPILFDAFARSGKTARAAAACAAQGALFAATAKLPPPLQRFRPGGLPSAGDRAAARASCFRPTARGSSSPPTPAASPIRSR